MTGPPASAAAPPCSGQWAWVATATRVLRRQSRAPKAQSATWNGRLPPRTRNIPWRMRRWSTRPAKRSRRRLTEWTMSEPALRDSRQRGNVRILRIADRMTSMSAVGGAVAIVCLLILLLAVLGKGAAPAWKDQGFGFLTERRWDPHPMAPPD